MLILLYSAALTLVIAGMALRAAVSRGWRQNYREGLEERLGRVRPELAAVAAGKRVIWLHAVSVGEVLAASWLVKELREALGEGWEIAVSTTTHTGQALAQERFGAERVFYMPIDFGFSMRAYLKALRPEAVVLIESEVWPRMMHECRKRGIPMVVVNARVSDRSFQRSVKMRWLWSRVLRSATLWLAQSEEDARRLVEMGAPAQAVKVGGNLKYDVRATKESRIAKLIQEAAAGRPIVVAGSTVHGDPRNEDSYVMGAWQGRLHKELKAMLVLAPRHPGRFAEVYAKAAEFSAVKATEMAARETNDGLAAVRNENKPVEIVVLDTIGDLAAVYSVADVAFVGGSLIPKGGHNPLEPAQFGVPVIIGPSFENFRGIVEKMQQASAISILDAKANAAEKDGAHLNGEEEFLPALQNALESEFYRLLTDKQAATTMGEHGRSVFEEQQGATKRAVDAIAGMVKR